MSVSSICRGVHAAALLVFALGPCLAQSLSPSPSRKSPTALAAAHASPVIPDRHPGSAPGERPRLQAGGLSLDESGARYRSDASDGRLSASIGRDWGSAGGLRLGIDYARLISDTWAVGLNGVAGIEHQEIVLNGLYSPRPDLHVGASLGWLRDTNTYPFHSGPDDVVVAQGSALVRVIKRFEQHRWLSELNASAYVSRARKPDVPDAVMFEDSPTTLRVLVDPREISPGHLQGFNLGLGLTPWSNADIRLSLGRERLRYRFQDGSFEKSAHTTAGLTYAHSLSDCWEVLGRYDTAAAGDRVSFGLRRGSWHLALTRDSGSAGMKARTRLLVGMETSLGAAPPRCGGVRSRRAAEVHRLDEVFQRPRELPTRALAKVDLTARPSVLATLDKAGLSGATVSATPDALILRTALPATTVLDLLVNGASIPNVGADGHPVVWVQGGALHIGVRRFPNPGAGVGLPAEVVFEVIDPIHGPTLSSATFIVQGF